MTKSPSLIHMSPRKNKLNFDLLNGQRIKKEKNIHGSVQRSPSPFNKASYESKKQLTTFDNSLPSTTMDVNTLVDGDTNLRGITHFKTIKTQMPHPS